MEIAMKEIPNLPEVECKCFTDVDETGCVCGQSERVLRAICRGDIALNDEQREWCKAEIDRVEGYSRSEYEIADDATLAHGVLSAWTDYARDKGLM